MNATFSDPGLITANVEALKGFGVVLLAGLLALLLGNQTAGKGNADGETRAATLGVGKHGQENAQQVRRRINSIVDAAEKEVDSLVKLLDKRFEKLSRLAEQANESQSPTTVVTWR